MTKDELFYEMHALAMKARDNGLEKEGNNVLLTAIGEFMSNDCEYSKENIAAVIRVLAIVCNANGYTYARNILSHVAIALLLGEQAEIDLGVGIAVATLEHKKEFIQSDYYWPDDLDQK